MKTLHLDIVSAERAIFSGDVQMVFATGIMGELGIALGHSPLLTELKPGNVRAQLSKDVEEIFYISGGMLEVQRKGVTILADNALRAADIDEAKVLLAKEKAEQVLANNAAEVDYARASIELAQISAQIVAIQALRKRAK